MRAPFSKAALSRVSFFGAGVVPPRSSGRSMGVIVACWLVFFAESVVPPRAEVVR